MEKRARTHAVIVLSVLILLISFFSSVSFGIFAERTEGREGVLVENGGVKTNTYRETDEAAEKSGSVSETDETDPEVVTDVPTGVFTENVYIADGTDTRLGKGALENKTGLAKCISNGRWIYVEDGIFRQVTGVVRSIDNGKQFYVENGYLSNVTGIVPRLLDGIEVYVENGVFREATGIAERLSDKAKLYVENGVVQRYTGYTTEIGKEEKLVYCKNGEEIPVKRTFTGVLNGKKYSNSVLVEEFQTQDWIRLMDEAYAADRVQVRNGTLSKEKWKTLREAMKVYQDVTTSYGFVALNTKTGLTVSYNSDVIYASASTIKAPYIAAICKYDLDAVKTREGDIYRALQFSDNIAYGGLFLTYGTEPIYTFAKEADSAFVLDEFGYTSMMVKDLAKLWAPMKEYLDSDGKNVSLLKDNLLIHTAADGKTFRDYYKKGWWEQTPTLAGVYNCAGSGDDWIYAVMSNHPDMFGLPQEGQEVLISALSEVIH